MQDFNNMTDVIENILSSFPQPVTSVTKAR
jgi:hypothetical protein